MLGRVHEDHHLVVDRIVELLQLDTVRRAEGRGVVISGPHILETTQRPETVPLVPVERLLLAHPLPHRMRVGVDPVVVGVIVDRLGVNGLDGHLLPPRC